MTHPTDEELDALVGMLQQRDKSKHGYIGHPLYNRNGPQAVDAITALRAQLAEARADLTFMTENRNKWQDSATQRWFRIEEANARADRAEAERDVWEIDAKRNHQAAEIEFARADRAEAELAAQIEADAGLIDALYRMALKDSDDDLSSPWKSHKASAYGTALQTIRNQPQDRTALDRMLRAEREKALLEAADELKGQGYNTAVRQILALIEQPKDTK